MNCAVIIGKTVWFFTARDAKTGAQIASEIISFFGESPPGTEIGLFNHSRCWTAIAKSLEEVEKVLDETNKAKFILLVKKRKGGGNGHAKN